MISEAPVPKQPSTARRHSRESGNLLTNAVIPAPDPGIREPAAAGIFRDREQLTKGRALREANRRIENIDARILLQYAARTSRAEIAAYPERLLTADQAADFSNLVARREAGEPVAYLIGEREFYGLIFKVTPDVLIPRPETELLVELALDRMPAPRSCNALDLGTGSGAIAITLARNRPSAAIVAADVSEAALFVARENITRLGAASTVNLLLSDWFSGLGDRRFDLIVANPPYIAADDPHLEQGDVRFEPRSALVGGDDGLQCIRHIVAHAREHLKPGGWLLFEHGYEQADDCRELLQAAGYIDILSRRDLAGIPRAAGGRRRR